MNGRVNSPERVVDRYGSPNFLEVDEYLVDLLSTWPQSYEAAWMTGGDGFSKINKSHGRQSRYEYFAAGH